MLIHQAHRTKHRTGRNSMRVPPEGLRNTCENTCDAQSLQTKTPTYSKPASQPTNQGNDDSIALRGFGTLCYLCLKWRCAAWACQNIRACAGMVIFPTQMDARIMIAPTEWRFKWIPEWLPLQNGNMKHIPEWLILQNGNMKHIPERLILQNGNMKHIPERLHLQNSKWNKYQNDCICRIANGTNTRKIAFAEWQMKRRAVIYGTAKSMMPVCGWDFRLNPSYWHETWFSQR